MDLGKWFRRRGTLVLLTTLTVGLFLLVLVFMMVLTQQEFARQSESMQNTTTQLLRTSLERAFQPLLAQGAGPAVKQVLKELSLQEGFVEAHLRGDGELVLVLDPALFPGESREFRLLIHVVLLAATLVFAVLLFLTLQRWYFSPLRRLKTVTQNWRQGVYKARVENGDTREFREIAHEFNSFAVEMAVKESELEARVAARTAELMDALVRLDKTRDAFAQQEKMASLGLLAAGMAHEINNPTSYIVSNLGTLGEHLSYLKTIVLAPNPEEKARAVAADDLDFILSDLDLILADSLKGATRIQEIVQGLRFFARGEEGTPARCDLNELALASLRLVNGRLKYHCEVVTELGTVPPFLAHPSRIEQVIINLLTNAADAISGHGRVTLRTWASVHTAYLTVSDSGSGMDEETLRRIFEPFFTTKDVGKGTGLGLSISQGLVAELRGNLAVESRPGEGSTFTMSLPLEVLP